MAEAALAALDDILHRRKTGKALRARNVNGDLSGPYRVKFDADDRRPERYRLVYQIQGGVVRVRGFGPHHGHAVYQQIAARLPSPPED